ncbi:amidase [Virgibacillus natechei]
MTDLAYYTASELAPLIEEKKLSPVELTETILKRMEKIDPIINSYITPLHELALQQAKCAEKEIMNNFYRGPLHGIPVGIKDNMHTRGIRTTVGSKMLDDFYPNITATVVEKLIGFGGVMMGKLNLSEFAIGPSNINPFYGSARNPWNPGHVTGGSSGGSAAALAAGLTTIATGSDTYGSIRNPASMCGVYGLKPTYGLVSAYGITPTAQSMDHVGPMARSVPDLAFMMNHMAGYDANDPGSIKANVPDYLKGLNKGVKGLRIGIPCYFLQGLDPEVEKSFKKALEN